MLGPVDEFPIHQIPQPIAWPGSSDRNFYDRSYLNAHDRTGDIFLITGIGYYPNLGVKDAFVLLRRGDTQTAVHLSDGIDSDRLNQHVGGYRIEVTEPLHKLRVILEETEGMAVDLTWEGLFAVVQEQRHVLRTGNRITLGRAAIRPAGHLERSHRGRRRGDHRRPRGVAGQPRPVLGYPADRRARAGGPARAPAVRGHVVAVRADGVRRLRDRADHPGGAQRLPQPQRLHPRSGGTAGSSNSAGRG